MIETFLLCLVIGIVDGDTLRVRCDRMERAQLAQPVEFKVRLHAIDAPERGHPHWRESRSALSALTFNRRVDLECFYNSGSRKVCTVDVVNDGETVNKFLQEPAGYDAALAMVAEGWAVHHQKFKHEQNEHERKLYETAEQAARSAARGMWQAGNHVEVPRNGR